MPPGKQIEMFFKNESGKDSVQKAREYLANPNYLDIYQGYLKEYGNRNKGARGIVEVINSEVGFPLAFWDSKKPDIINYKNTEQIKEFIESNTIQKAA